MALNHKPEFIRNITMMVRKESILFEPQDRVDISSLSAVTQDGRVLNYLVGGVYYNSTSGKVEWRMYNSDGQFICPANGGRQLEELTGKVLLSVEDMVCKYFEQSMYRARNLMEIENLLPEIENEKLYILKSHVSNLVFDIAGNGDFISCPVVSIFKGEDQKIYVEAIDLDKGQFNYPVNRLTDMGVASLHSAIQQEIKVRKNLDSSIQNEKKSKEVKNKKHQNRMF